MDSFVQHPGMIILFVIVVSVMLLLDLGVFNKKQHEVSSKEALIWSFVWISLSMLFSGLIWHNMGLEKFAQFQSAYWIEKALSVDNLFVFILVFRQFKVPKILEHKILFYGVIGALLFRAIFIFAGVGLIKMSYLPPIELFGHEVRINVLMLLFGIFLLIAGIKSWFKDQNEEAEDYEQSAGAKFIYRLLPIKKTFEGGKFFIRENGKLLGTSLLVVLSIIEFTDLLFAVDSIPAIFAIAPDDPIILYTSNIFAILGLRSLYFLLANFMEMFRLLKYGLAIILSFIGVKMILQPFIHIESSTSLLIVGSVLIISVLASIFTNKQAIKH